VRLTLLNSDARGRIASETDVLDDTLRMNFVQSNVVIRDRRAEHARLDGLDLLRSLGRTTPWWDKKIQKNNPFKAERLSRDFFELYGAASKNEAIMDHCSQIAGRSLSGKLLLDKSTFAELLRRLRKEYGNSDE
jgi:hypothetical protein